MNWELLEGQFVALYAGEFSRDELDAMVEFYETPVGQKVIEKLPIVLERGAAIGQQAVQAHADELRDAIQEQARKLQGQQDQPK